MVAVAAVNVALGGRSVAVPRGLDFAALVLVGVSLGASINRGALSRAANLIVPELLILGILSGVGVLLALTCNGFSVST